jgi:hypothetical protein
MVDDGWRHDPSAPSCEPGPPNVAVHFLPVLWSRSEMRLSTTRARTAR